MRNPKLCSNWKSVLTVSLVLAVSLAAWTTPVQAAYIDAVTALNPMHYWRFSETTGTSASDEVGSKTGTHNNGVTVGAAGPRTADGFAGLGTDNLAPAYDGFNDDTTFANPDDLGPTKKFSTGVGALSTSFFYKSDNSATVSGVFAGYMQASGARYIFQSRDIAPTSDGPQFFVVDSSANSASLITSDVADTDWHHVVQTWDGTTLTYWIDGGSGTPGGYTYTQTGPSGNLATPTHLIMGRDANGTSPLNGRLDEFAIFDYALSGTQVVALYNAATVPEPSVVAMLLVLSLTGLLSRRRR